MDVHPDLSQPKSIVFSPDGGRVYLGQYGSSSILAFDISMPSSIGCTPSFLLVFLVMNICFWASSDIFFDQKKKAIHPFLRQILRQGQGMSFCLIPRELLLQVQKRHWQGFHQ
jgi:hypothetical protein